MKCKNCGTETVGMFCSNCGNKVEEFSNDVTTEKKSQFTSNKKWIIIGFIVIGIIIVATLGILGIFNSKKGNINNSENIIDTNINMENTENVESIKDIDTGNANSIDELTIDIETSNIKEANTLEELESIVSTDVESTINGLSNEWEELKKEINTYDEYLNKIEKVEEYYEKIETITEQLCVRLYVYSANCADLILTSNEEYKDKYDDLEIIKDVIYEDVREEIKDEIYDGILNDMKDTFYDGIIKDAKDTITYSDWYDTRSDEYEIWYDTRSAVYETYYDTGSDIYGFYYDLRGDVYSNDMEDANETFKDFQEDVSKISNKGGQTNTQKIEKIESNVSIENNTETIDNNIEEKNTTENTAPNSDELSKDFKEAMDSYEEFMNEYVEFIKKYEANPTDMTLISQYATMLQKYSEQISNFNKWESKNMTTEEAAYYIDVQARVSKKILEISK